MLPCTVASAYFAFAYNEQRTIVFCQTKFIVFNGRTVNRLGNLPAFCEAQLGASRLTAIVDGKDICVIFINRMLSKPNMRVVTVTTPKNPGRPRQLSVYLMVRCCILFMENTQSLRQVFFKGQGQEIYITPTKRIFEEQEKRN